MRKITGIVTFLLVTGFSTVAFAANPFDFVPAGHWSYDSVNALVEDGAFFDYKDLHFQKDQVLTRYEMSVLLAKAVANGKQPSAKQKVVLDKLMLEFKDELHQLGISIPQDHVVPLAAPAAGNVNLSGYYRLRYQNQKDKVNPGNSYHSLYSRIEVDATAKISNGWSSNLAWEAYRSFYSDAGQRYGTMASAWGANGYNGVNDLTIANVTGPLLGTTMTVGKFRHVFGSGLMFDDKVSGIRFDFGNKLKTQLVYAEADSNIEGNTPKNSYLSKLSKVTSAEFRYDLSKATRLTTSLQNWVSKTPNVDSLQVIDFNVTTALNNNLSLYATYDQTSASDDNKAYVIGLAYKGVDPNKQGSFGAFLDYESFGRNTTIDTTYSLLLAGTKGFATGFNYVPIKNVKWTNVFVYSKALGANDIGSMGRAEATGAGQKFLRSQVFYYF